MQRRPEEAFHCKQGLPHRGTCCPVPQPWAQNEVMGEIGCVLGRRPEPSLRFGRGCGRYECSCAGPAQCAPAFPFMLLTGNEYIFIL